MAPTLADIAREAKVAQSTVSAVLNNRRQGYRIPDPTRDRILAISQKMKYRPSFTAQALATGKTYSIGAVCGGIYTPHVARLLGALIKEAADSGYHLLVSTAEWGQEPQLACVDVLLQRQVDGIFMMSHALQEDTEEYKLARDKEIPLIRIGEDCTHMPSVNSDWANGMDQTMAYLKNAGHKRTGLITMMPAQQKHPQLQIQTYIDACEKYGLQHQLFRCTDQPESVRSVAYRIGRSKSPVDVVIARSDQLAMGAIRGFRDAGLSVPENIGVVGINGSREGEYFDPQLTTISQDISQIAQQAMKLFQNKNSQNDNNLDHVRIPMKLIVRGSA